MSGTPSLADCLRSLRAVVFDTDGVIIDSARVHAAAWQGAFDACLSAAGGQRPFDPVSDYLRHVDGRSRLDGAAGFLASRGLDLPLGDPDDAPGTATVWAVAARKEELFTASVRAHGVAAWPGTVRLLHTLGRERVSCAAVSASRHATELMTAAGVIPSSGVWWTATKRASWGFRANRTRRSSLRRPDGWGFRLGTRRCWRTHWPVSRPAGGADSVWWWEWTVRPGEAIGPHCAATAQMWS